MPPRKRLVSPVRLVILVAVIVFVFWYLLSSASSSTRQVGSTKPILHHSVKSANPIPPRTHQPFKSQYHCESLDGGLPHDSTSSLHTVDVLGEQMSPFHYCVIRDACVATDGRLHIFDTNLQAAKEYDFPKLVGKTFPNTIMTPDTSILDSIRSQGKFHKGSSVLLAHGALMPGSNPTFSMEPLGALHAAYKKLIKKKDCKPTDLDCIEPIREVTELSWLEAEGWAQYATRIAVDDSFPTQLKFTSSRGLRERCYEKLLVPGSLYDVWPSEKVASAWSEHAQGWLSRAKVGEKDEGTKWMLQNEVHGKFLKPNNRVLLYGIRFFRRRIADRDPFEKLLAFTLKRVNADFRIVECLRHSFMSQAAQIQEADIFLSMHGADLTNLAWFPQGRGITIEMNPLWFFEPRYRKMSQLLGQKHYGLTCNSHKCAFGGDEGKFDAHVAALKGYLSYDKGSRDVTAGDSTFKWPAVMLPDSEPCEQCEKLNCCSEGKDWLRFSMDSDIAVMPIVRDVVEVLAHAFESLGWLPGQGQSAVESFVDDTLEVWYKETTPLIQHRKRD